MRFRVGKEREVVYGNKTMLLFRWAGDYYEQFSVFFQKIFDCKSELTFEYVNLQPFLHLLEFLYCGRFVSFLTVTQVNEVL